MEPTFKVNYAKTAGGAATAANATNATNATQLGARPASYYAPAGHPAVLPVGSAGEPAFRNGWKNYGGAWSRAGFWKDASGVVHLQGTLTGKKAGKVAFQLPVGYRPAADIFTVAAAGNQSTSIEILANGEILIIGSGAVGLDGLTFLAGPSTTTARQIRADTTQPGPWEGRRRSEYRMKGISPRAPPAEMARSVDSRRGQERP
jgi:hypothetical protein